MVVPRFVAQAPAGRPLRVLGDGRQTRCFAHVLDVVAAVHALAGASAAAASEVFDVGSQEDVSILDLAARVMTAAGVDLAVEGVRFPKGFHEPRRRVPNIAKITARVGWAPTYDLDDIVRDSVAAHGDLRRPVVTR